jgi:hypothetical protein
MKHLKKFETYKLNEKLSVLYHGSPHEFDSFTTDFIGSGEGNRVFGWGLYFTDSKDIATDYAYKLTSNKYVGEWYKIREELEELFPMIDLGKNIRLLTDLRNGMNGNRLAKNREHYINQILKYINPSRKWIHDDDGEAVTEIDYITKKATAYIDHLISLSTYNASLYTVKVHLDRATWLDWYEKPEEHIIDKIKRQVAIDDIQIQFKTYTYKLTTILQASYPKGHYQDIREGSELYQVLCSWLGSDKEASMFLMRAGIDGIRYPANSIATGDFAYTDDKYKNYVLFDHKAIVKTAKKVYK